jgi:hypothetical protein
MVFSATFNDISVISWRSFLLVEEAEYPQKTTDLSQVTDTVYHIMLHQVQLAWSGFELTTLVVKEGSYKANYRTITTTTAPAVFGSTAYNFRWEMIVIIGWIVDNKCLSFLFYNQVFIDKF